MARVQTLYKKATTSVPLAVEELTKRYPGAEIDGIVVKAADASEARMAKVSVGERIFVATVKHAEFPAGDGPDEDSAPEESAPDEEPKDDKPEPPKSEGEGEKKPESKGDGEGADDGPPGPEGEGEKKPNKDDLLLEVLQALLVKLDDGGLGGDPLGDPGIAEVGAPGAGEPMPPHAMKPHGPGPGGPPPGPGGPGGHGAPLPPPVSKPAGPGGVAFGHYNPKAAEFSVMRKDAGEIGNRGLILETESVYPTHRVAKITRTGLAEVNGELLDVAEAGIALLTLTKK